MSRIVSYRPRVLLFNACVRYGMINVSQLLPNSPYLIISFRLTPLLYLLQKKRELCDALKMPLCIFCIVIVSSTLNEKEHSNRSVKRGFESSFHPGFVGTKLSLRSPLESVLTQSSPWQFVAQSAENFRKKNFDNVALKPFIIMQRFGVVAVTAAAFVLTP